MKKHFCILVFFFLIFLGSNAYGQSSNAPSNDGKTTIHPDTLAKWNSKAKVKEAKDAEKNEVQPALKPEKASTCNGDNNPLKKPE